MAVALGVRACAGQEDIAPGPGKPPGVARVQGQATPGRCISQRAGALVWRHMQSVERLGSAPGSVLNAVATPYRRQVPPERAGAHSRHPAAGAGDAATAERPVGGVACRPGVTPIASTLPGLARGGLPAHHSARRTRCRREDSPRRGQRPWLISAHNAVPARSGAAHEIDELPDAELGAGRSFLVVQDAGRELELLGLESHDPFFNGACAGHAVDGDWFAWPVRCARSGACLPA